MIIKLIICVLDFWSVKKHQNILTFVLKIIHIMLFTAPIWKVFVCVSYATTLNCRIWIKCPTECFHPSETAGSPSNEPCHHMWRSCCLFSIETFCCRETLTTTFTCTHKHIALSTHYTHYNCEVLVNIIHHNQVLTLKFYLWNVQEMDKT